MKRTLIILGLLLILQPVLPHFRARYHVVVDTDGGIDDFRAICMMLASPQIEIIAITATDGLLDPELTVQKVRSMLEGFGHQGIPVGLGKSHSVKPGSPSGPAWNEGASRMAGQLDWSSRGAASSSAAPPGAVELILESIDLEEMPVDIVALGPLNNLSNVFREKADTPGRIRKVYWQNRPGNNKDFNYAFNPAAADKVLESGCSIDRVHTGEGASIDLDAFLVGLDTLSSRYAAAISKLYSNAPPDFSRHFMAKGLADDCIPLFLLYPQYFSLTCLEENTKLCTAEALPYTPLAEKMLEMLDSDREDKSIIFSRFPTDTTLFEKDVAKLAPGIIKKHGIKEWKIVVLTNEFHEHLGIYSILGAKMGLRAREYFNVGIDELQIITHAGSHPPVSCMNDGLQVSTGATMGYGTIRLGEGQTSPKARFSFKNRVIEISIKKEVREKIRKDVGQAVQVYGLESQEYWVHIRKLALEYWLDLSRYEIFNIQEAAFTELSSR